MVVRRGAISPLIPARDACGNPRRAYLFQRYPRVNLVNLHGKVVLYPLDLHITCKVKLMSTGTGSSERQGVSNAR